MTISCACKSFEVMRHVAALYCMSRDIGITRKAAFRYVDMSFKAQMERKWSEPMKGKSKKGKKGC